MEIMRDFMKSKIPELVVPNDLSIHKKKIVFLGEDGIVLTLDGFVITSLAWYKVRHFQLKLYKIRRNAENTYLSQMEDTKELKKEDTIFKYVYKIEKKSSE